MIPTKSLALGLLLPALAFAQTGDEKCGTYMCVSAVVNGTTVTYEMKSTGSSPLGYMAMGFGTRMAGSPMVIMWPNTDGTVTLSHRSASGQVEPQVNEQPPRVATIDETLTTTSGNTPSLAFSMLANSETSQDIVWAYSSSAPSSSAVDASIEQHVDAGRFTTFDLTKSLATEPDSSSPTSGSGTGSDEVIEPLTSVQKMIIAHAILSVVGFLLLLPFGALLARYFRTATPRWYTGHWISQFALAGPVILVGFVLGVVGVERAGAIHLYSTHQKLGLALFVLYIAQCTLGAVIHFFKPSRPGRPPQNYAHAVVGLALIGISYYQVRSGYKEEWVGFTGLDPLPKGVDILWIVWIVLLPVLYVAGLYLLRKQFAQEKASKARLYAKEQDTYMQS